jgi:hypothetical protein
MMGNFYYNREKSILRCKPERRKCAILVLRATYTNSIRTGRANGQLVTALVHRPEKQCSQRPTGTN